MLLYSMEGISLIVEILIKFQLWFFRRNAHITSILGDRKKNRLIYSFKISFKEYSSNYILHF